MSLNDTHSTVDLEARRKELIQILADTPADDICEDDQDELAAIEALKEELGEELWESAYLISDNDFTEYAQDEAEEVGLIAKDNHWPANHVDWEAAAHELKQDYSSVEFQNTTYWYRG